MDSYIGFAVFVFVCIICFCFYVIHSYYYKTYIPIFNDEICTVELNELYTILDEGISVLRYNYDVLLQNDIYDLDPSILLARYPFYQKVLRIAQYLDKHYCIQRIDIHNVMYQRYGEYMRNSPDMYVLLSNGDYRYILLDIEDSFTYYMKHRDYIWNIIL